MFIKRRLSTTAVSSISMSLMKLPLIVMTLLVAMAFSVLSQSSALAAEASILGVGGTKAEKGDGTSIPDSFGRDTPRDTVQGFIAALGENDYLLASNYLNLSKADNPTTIVRQFKQALDAGGRFQTDLQIDNTPEGNLTDQLPPSQENVGVIKVSDTSIPLLLERVVTKEGEQYWQFSSETLSSIPEAIENYEPTLVSRYTIASLEGKKLFDYQLADLVAALMITISSFLFTYIAVWLLYHLLAITYPRLRDVALPLPDKVILPLAVVIMALILSEVMVYAGVSVTLREPVNRFAEIASWVAITWLLLRIIDALFTRAVNLSYKKNHTERVSILGLLRKVVKALLLIFAVIVTFGNLGFDLTTGIAALGVGGLALALGAQKTIENLVGSVVVVADSPVRIGDYCKFGTYEGTVIDIGIRSSRVRTLTRTIVTVPNGDFSSMQIENFTSRDMFRFLHQLYIKRTADINVVFKMVNHLDKFLDEHELTNQEWNQVNILELRQDCYIIQLQAYINATGIIEFYEKQDMLFVDLLMQVRQYDVEHALPTQQLIVKQPELQAELDHESKEGETVDKKSDKKIATDNKPEAVNLSKDSDVFDTENDNKPPEPEPKQKPKEHLLDNRYKAIHKSSGHALARLKFKQVKNSFRFPRAKK